MSRSSHLLHSRRFLPLFVTQFLGALNDNVIKNAMVVLLTFQSASWTTLAPEILANLAAGIFILPFFLFSAIAGQLADKFDKARLARISKALEIAIVLIAGAGFFLQQLSILLTALFLLGLQSTLFGPVKYSILPQHLRDDELVSGNAMIEAGTFVAILLGTLLGGLLAGTAGATSLITVTGLVIAVVGYLASRSIPHAVPPAPGLQVDLNPLSSTWRTIGYARENRTVFLSILGISWFWLYGALLLAQFPAYTKNVLGGSETAVTLLLAVFTLGIGVGSMLCEKLSGGRVELGLVPLGSIGLTLFGLDLALASPSLPAAAEPLGAIALLAYASTWRILADLILIGLFGGFFIVPLYALVQQRSNPEHRARIIAANNILNALFMVVGALAAAGLLSAGMSIPTLFAIAATANAAIAVYIYGLVPEFLVRFVIWMLVHSVMRLKVEGAEHLPANGPALLLAEHLGRTEALLLLAASRRPVRLVLTPSACPDRFTQAVFRQSNAILEPGETLSAPSLKALHDALGNAQLVAVEDQAGQSLHSVVRDDVPRLALRFERGAGRLAPVTLHIRPLAGG